MRLPLLSATVLLGLVAGCGPSVDVGTTMISTYSVHVTRESDFTAGANAKFAIKLDNGTKVDSVQDWYGAETDPTRIDGDFDSNDGDYDTEVPIANPMPAGAMLWIAITNGGQTTTGSIAAK